MTKYSYLKLSLKVNLFYVVIFGITILLNGLIAPLNIYVISQLIDEVMRNVQNQLDFKPLIPIFLLFLFLQLFIHLHFIIDYFYGMKFKHQVNHYFFSMIISKIAKLEYRHIEDKITYDLIHRIKKDTESNIKDSLMHLGKITSVIISIIGVFIVVMEAGWWISSTILIVIVLSSILAYFASTRELKDDRAYSELERKMEYFEDLFMDKEIAHEIRLFGSNKHLMKVLSKLSDAVVKRFFWLQVRIRTNFENILKFIGYLIVLCAYIVLLFPLQDKIITLGFYIAIINSLWKLVPLISVEVPKSLQFLFRSHFYWQEVNSFFQLSEITGNDKNLKNLDFSKIEFEHVYFKYPNTSKYILEDINFTFEKGKHYALVGKNGAGKSTIIKLLTGLYRIDEGNIFIDGININDYKQEELNKLFSVVFQDFGRYMISVLDNIKLSSINTPIDWLKIKGIAEKLTASQYIDQSPKGYYTMLGKLTSDSVDLSLGEWQKLSLFRSLYSDCALRILDEPTAALDPQAESNLYQIFEKSLSKNSSTIFISHRLGSTKLADEIILIDQGRIIEKGSHQELMRLNGLYRSMFDTQKSWYK